MNGICDVIPFLLQCAYYLGCIHGQELYRIAFTCIAIVADSEPYCSYEKTALDIVVHNSSESAVSVSPEHWDWWWGIWKNRIRCGSCRAIMDLALPCPVCATDYRKVGPTKVVVDGRIMEVPPAFAGALDWSPYVMLQLMYREWLRPPGDLEGLPKTNRPSSRVLIVLIFWTYFETLMGWFYETATSDLPSAVGADLLARYGFIGSRIGRLHRILFGATYGQDLDGLGFTPVREHLEKVQRLRNAFVHGKPEAIGDALVDEVVKMMPDFQDAWIQSFNRRCAKHP